MAEDLPLATVPDLASMPLVTVHAERRSMFATAMPPRRPTAMAGFENSVVYAAPTTGAGYLLMRELKECIMGRLYEAIGCRFHVSDEGVAVVEAIIRTLHA